MQLFKKNVYIYTFIDITKTTGYQLFRILYSTILIDKYFGNML